MAIECKDTSLDLIIGNTYNLQFVVKNKDDTDRSLVGSQSVTMAIAKRPQDAALLTYDLTSTISTNTVTVELEITTLKSGRYYYELWQIDANGDYTTLGSGMVYLKDSLIG